MCRMDKEKDSCIGRTSLNKIKRITMNTANIRQQLQNYLEVADDKKVKAIYTMMEDEIKEVNSAYSDELKAELDKRYASYKSGKTRMVSAAESKKRINKILNKQKAK